jgi:hypothetical protein
MGEGRLVSAVLKVLCILLAKNRSGAAGEIVIRSQRQDFGFTETCDLSSKVTAGDVQKRTLYELERA